jgi:hypothetical protein
VEFVNTAVLEAGVIQMHIMRLKNMAISEEEWEDLKQIEMSGIITKLIKEVSSLKERVNRLEAVKQKWNEND